jgi:CheY-like chemotaxis protein
MHFLVVDPNIAFATLLSDELERLGHKGEIVTDGQKALASAKLDCPDMTFLDMGLGVSEVATLGQALRSLDDSMRLVVIPMNGEALPEDVEALSIQGTLPKPFFLPELPDRVEQALSKPLGNESPGLDVVGKSESRDPTAAEASEPLNIEDRNEVSGSQAQPRFSPQAFAANRERIQGLMTSLSADVGADGVILTRGENLLTWVGRFNDEEAQALARVVIQGWESSAEVARILGQEQLRFEQSIAGGTYLLYAVSVVDAILAVPVQGAALLGLLRQSVRRIAKQIATLCLD